MSEATNTTDELLKEVALETEEKTPGAGSIQFEPEAEPKTYHSDLELDPEPQPEPPPTNGVSSKTLLSPDLSADLAVGAIDFIQTMLFTALVKWKTKKQIGPEDYDNIKVLVNEMEAKLKDWNDLHISEKAKVRILERMNKKITELPFNDKEYENLYTTIKEMIKEMPGYQLPPSMGLSIALAQALVPRAIDILMD